MTDEFFPDSLPPFANDAVRAKFYAYQETQKAADAVALKAAEYTERIRQLTEHLKNVSDEVDDTQVLLNVKQKENERLSHENELKKREASRIKQEGLILKKQQREVQDAIVSTSMSVETTKSNMREVQEKLNWSEKELSQWVSVLKQKMEDEMVLGNYRKSDDFRLKELQRQLESLTLTKSEQNNQLSDLMTETQSLDVELSKVNYQLQSASEERDDEIREWERLITLNKNRDMQLSQLGQEYVSVLSQQRSRQNEIDKLSKFSHSLEKLNINKQISLETSDTRLGCLRVEALKAKNESIAFQDDLVAAKSEMQGSASELDNIRKQLKNTEKDNNSKESKLLNMKDLIVKEESRLNSVESSKNDKENMSVEARKTAQEAFERLAEKEKQKRAGINNLMLANQELSKRRDEEMNKVGEISGYMTADKNITNQTRKLEDERSRQKAMIYSADFEGQLMRRKLAKLGGETTAEEKRDLLKESADVDSQIVEHKKLLSTVASQVKKQENDIKLTRKELDASLRQHETYKNSVQELELQSEVATRDLAILLKDQDEKASYRDVLKLESIRHKDALSKTIESVFEAESELSQTSSEVIERETKMENAKEIVKSEIRQLSDQKHKLLMKLSEAITKCNHLETKYQSLIACRRTEDGQVHSQAYYLMKSAQKRDELQRKGDDLDIAVQTAERELRAMENSLEYMRSSNRTYAQVLKKSDTKNEDSAHLEDKIVDVNNIIHKNLRLIQQLEIEAHQDITLNLQQQLKQAETDYEIIVSESREIVKEVSVATARADEAARKLKDMSIPESAKRIALNQALDAIVEMSRGEEQLESFIQQKIQRPL